MAISTHSKIFYGLEVKSSFNFLDIKISSQIYSIELSQGSYTGSKLANEISKKINALTSPIKFTVIYNRIDRKFTISSTVNFELNCFTGVNVSRTAYQAIGFNLDSDKTGAQSYTSDVSTGFEYSTQLWLQSYKPTSNNRKSIEGSINKSSGGTVEVVKFGNERFMSCEFLYITNIIQGSDSIIRTNENGVQDFIKLMEWLTDKKLIEFMVDENNLDSFEVFLLESTEQDSKGLDFDLVELYDRGLPEYFRSGVLKFRLMG